MPRTAPSRFPAVDARGLDGRAYRLPADLPGERCVALVAFRREQQADVDTWLPGLLALAAERPGLAVVEIPVLGRRWTPARALIDGGMRAGIGDPEACARTLTAYTDTGRVQRALGLRGDGEIAVVLAGRDGRIAWQRTGPCREAALASLVEAL
ncbi:MAG: hypothetical protein MUC84_04435 [Solirubrobacteraceae bacterium]|nr:hypothetical protein [Solirubrobacteraceae bacterium]